MRLMTASKRTGRRKPPQPAPPSPLRRAFLLPKNFGRELVSVSGREGGRRRPRARAVGEPSRRNKEQQNSMSSPRRVETSSHILWSDLRIDRRYRFCIGNSPVPLFRKSGVFGTDLGTAKTRMFPSFFLLSYMSVPMFNEINDTGGKLIFYPTQNPVVYTCALISCLV